jgi:hypothetical protein
VVHSSRPIGGGGGAAAARSSAAPAQQASASSRAGGAEEQRRHMVEVFAVVAGVVRLGEREVELQRELRVFRAAVSDDVARTERHQPSTWLAVYNESERHNNSFCSAQVCEEIVNYLFAPLEVQMGTRSGPGYVFPAGFINARLCTLCLPHDERYWGLYASGCSDRVRGNCAEPIDWHIHR